MMRTILSKTFLSIAALALPEREFATQSNPVGAGHAVNFIDGLLLVRMT